jgi:threonine/homoserine/homoserine lactone efflux protein
VSLLHQIRTFLAKSEVRKTLERLSGGVLVALGLKLVLTPR